MRKLPKKKFQAGLESLFNDTTDAFLNEKVAYVEEETKPVKREKVKRVRAKGSSKNFTSDLDSLLEQALSESDDNQHQQKEAKGSVELKAKKRPVAISGLDALIRRTIDVQYVKDETEKKTKRVTISVDKKRLQRLKQIAREERAYLKDILGSLISEYIQKYEQENF